jgi:hypothetical protein
MTYSRLSTHDGDDTEEIENGVGSLTPLDRTIDRIGMGTLSLLFYATVV